MENEHSNIPYIIASAITSTLMTIPTAVILLLLIGGRDALLLSAASWIILFLTFFTIYLIHDHRTEQRYTDAITTLVGDERNVRYFTDCLLHASSRSVRSARIFCLDARLLIVTVETGSFGTLSFNRDDIARYELFPRNLMDVVMTSGARLRLTIPAADELLDAMRGLGWIVSAKELDDPPEIDDNSGNADDGKNDGSGNE